jgi:hypothetical protein
VTKALSHIGKNAKQWGAVRTDAKKDVKATLEAVKAGKPLDSAHDEAVQKVVKTFNAQNGDASSSLRTVGAGIDAAIPGNALSSAGRSVALDVQLRLPVPGAFGTAFLGVRIKGTAERTGDVTGKNGVTLDVQLGFLAGGQLPHVAVALGEAGFYMKAGGPTAAEAMEFVSFAMYRRFRESKVIPREITNALWGAGGVTAEKGESGDVAKYREAEAWGTGMEERMAAADGMGETGGYLAGEMSAKGGSAKMKASVRGTVGTRYDTESVGKGRKAGLGKAVETGRGAQSSIGASRVGVDVGLDTAIAGFGINGSASAAATKLPGSKGYVFDGFRAKVVGTGIAPASKLGLDDAHAKDASLQISNWVMKLLQTLRDLQLKAEKQQQEKLEGMSKTSQVIASRPILMEGREIVMKTNADHAGSEFLKAVHANSSGSGGSRFSPGALAGKAGDKAVGTARSVAKEVKYASQGQVTVTGQLDIKRDKAAELSIAFGTQSTMTVNVNAVVVQLDKTENLVKVFLLPDRKVLT